MDLNLANELTLNKQTKSFLLETAKWSKFLAIMGFIMVGFMVIGGLSFGSIMSAYSGITPGAFSATDSMPFGFIGVLYVVMALIYFFPIWYLYKFATKMKLAIQSDNETELTEAFSNLKSHYKFVGILTVIILSLYAFLIVGSIFFAAAF